MVVLTILVGVLVWGVMDRHISNAVKAMFDAHLAEMLEQQSQEDRLRFNRHTQAYNQVVRLVAAKKEFFDYIEEKKWFEKDNTPVRYYDRYPAWFLSSSALRALAIPRYVFLLDSRGMVREVYGRNHDELPEALLHPGNIIIMKSLDESHLASIDNFPFLVTSESVSGPAGRTATLMLASPVDDQFLISSQGDFPKRLVGFVSTDNRTILTSNNNNILPPGTLISSIEGKYVLKARSLHDYGGSEIPVKFTSFISKEEMENLSWSFVKKGRTYRALSALIFILAFTLIMVWITRRISRLTKRVEAFSQSALRTMEAVPSRGDKLSILEDRFHRLTEEVVTAQNIIREETEKKARKEAEIKQQEQLFTLLRSIMNALGIGIIVRQQNGLAAANDTMEQFVKKCGGMTQFEINHDTEEERIIKDVDKADHIFHLMSPALPGGEQVILVRDITAHKKLEDQLRHSQKMESVGQLAGGIAHDFNNFLTAIIGFTYLLHQNMKKDDPLNIYIDNILSSSKRAANLTHSLLAFSRKQIMNPQPVSLNEIVKRLDKLLVRLISEDIQLVSSLSEKEIIIKADPGQIEQVIMNLVTNARDAMPEGGMLKISTALVGLDSDYIQTHGYGKPGTYALLSVSDSGAGIDAAAMDKIFEPFYTSKEVGKGTGLGLAMAYGIIKQHEGYIDVYSEVGSGTSFKIYLPAINTSVSRLEEEIMPSVKGGDETILLAEDNKEVAGLIEKVLHDFGYSVLMAENGEEAVSLFMENREKVSLLLLDVIMPGKNGKEVYTEIRQVNPGIKTLFMSGYTADLINSKGILDEGMNLILKPVTPNNLLRKIREVLDNN